jgi:hypothetical protein
MASSEIVESVDVPAKGFFGLTALLEADPPDQF